MPTERSLPNQCGEADRQDVDGGRNVSILWYRHGLRLHDNPALLEALKDCKEFYPVFILDGNVAGTKNAAFPRMRFLHECLTDLDESYKEHGGRLYVFHGDVVATFRKLFQEWGVTKLTFEQDPEPVWRERDNAVKKLCSEEGVLCKEKVSHTLWDPAEVWKANGGHPPHTYKLFNQVVELLGVPECPVQDPCFKNIDLPISEDFDKFALPSLKDFCPPPECTEQENPYLKWQGGETEGLQKLQCRLVLEANAYKSGYVMPNQYKPDLVSPPQSLSPHLRFGCLSIRRFYWDLHKTYAKARPGESVHPSLAAQLIWREFFYCMSFNNYKYAEMKGNPICLQIPWYNDNELLEKFLQGKTGYPWIDACMNQLRQEGWMHHVGRHSVSCFMTRGDLWLSWEEGFKIFEKYLLDGDWSVCAGNWMWVSSSAFENCLQCPNCFSPIMYGMRMDPTGEFTRRYVPQLKKMPLRYLFQPWKAPLELQKQAECIVGEDYPKPIVDHRQASAKCKKLMEEVKAILKNPDILHCTPSDMEEVRQFCWLPDHMATGTACSASELCEGIEGL